MADYLVEGACDFCGQTQMLKANEPMTGSDADAYITAHCTCQQANKARARKEMNSSIEALFGFECVDMGFMPENDDVLRALKDLAALVDDEVLGNVQAALPGGDTVKIKLGGDGCAQVTRVLKRQKTM